MNAQKFHPYTNGTKFIEKSRDSKMSAVFKLHIVDSRLTNKVAFTYPIEATAVWPDLPNPVRQSQDRPVAIMRGLFTS